MRVAFLIDENVEPDIVQGLRRRAPAADILDVKGAGLQANKDQALLERAFTENRVLVTGDRNTMIRHFQERLASGGESAGVFILDTRFSIGELIEALVLVWTASVSDEYRNTVVFLPFR